MTYCTEIDKIPTSNWKFPEQSSFSKNALRKVAHQDFNPIFYFFVREICSQLILARWTWLIFLWNLWSDWAWKLSKKAKWWLIQLIWRNELEWPHCTDSWLTKVTIWFQQQLRCSMQQQFDSSNSIPNAGIAF